MNGKALHTLEYDKIIRLLEEEATSAPGRKLCADLLPMEDLDEIEQAQAETADAFSRIVKKGVLNFSGISPIDDIMRRLAIGASLNTSELLRIATLFNTAGEAKRYASQENPHTSAKKLRQNDVSNPEPEEEKPDSLTGFFNILEPVPTVANEIRRCILSENEISDSASPALRSIRRQLASMNDRIHDALGKIINGSGRNYLQDPVITLRNGRYCLPVRADHKNMIPGMVHDQSASGSTLFIEPMSVVKLNNEQKELAGKEQEEIDRILARLSDTASGYQTEMKRDYETLVRLDFIFAKGRLALRQNASRPLFNNDRYINIRKGRHPLLDPKTVVPIDLSLGKDFTLLVVTGPNTGGKTVSLKTIGLFTLMGEAGLHIPAGDRSQLGLFREVYADIGDEQSIEQSLSTFSAHMTNIADILKKTTADSLVLFDELGAGTDPVEGAALAASILSFLHAQDIRTMATTHYSELKVYALQTEGVRNASCEFDVETLRPTYRILIGIPGKSNAFAISARLGVPEDIIDDAKLRISEQDEAFEDLLTDLEKNRLSLEKQEAKLKNERETLKQERAAFEAEKMLLTGKRDAMLQEAKEESARILQEAKNYADETMRTFRKFGKENVSSSDMEREREALRKKLKKSQAQKNNIKKEPHKQHKISDFQIGDLVYVHSMNVKGTVTALPDSRGNLMVQMGIIRSRVHYTDLEILPDTEITGPDNFKKAGTGSAAGKIKMSKSMTASSEINLLGMTVDEAVAAVEKFLDDAYLAHLTQVRIIHGKGTGKLRAGIHNYLRKKARHVKDFHLAGFGEGDAGVTIVTFK